MMVVMAGLPGTGKSTLAHALASRLDGLVLGKDEIRLSLFSQKGIEYSTAQDDFVMQVMLEAAGWILRKDPERLVILDGRTFSRQYQIDRVLEAAAELHQSWCILECVCSEKTARTRLEMTDLAHPAENRTFALYLEVKARYERILHPSTIIDTDKPLEECVNRALSAIT